MAAYTALAACIGVVIARGLVELSLPPAASGDSKPFCRGVVTADEEDDAEDSRGDARELIVGTGRVDEGDAKIRVEGADDSAEIANEEPLRLPPLDTLRCRSKEEDELAESSSAAAESEATEEDGTAGAVAAAAAAEAATASSS